MTRLLEGNTELESCDKTLRNRNYTNAPVPHPVWPGVGGGRWEDNREGWNKQVHKSADCESTEDAREEGVNNEICGKNLNLKPSKSSGTWYWHFARRVETRKQPETGSYKKVSEDRYFGIRH